MVSRLIWSNRVRTQMCARDATRDRQAARNCGTTNGEQARFPSYAFRGRPSSLPIRLAGTDVRVPLCRRRWTRPAALTTMSLLSGTRMVRRPERAFTSTRGISGTTKRPVPMCQRASPIRRCSGCIARSRPSSRAEQQVARQGLPARHARACWNSMLVRRISLGCLLPLLRRLS